MFLLADGEGPDQTVRMHSLIWAFAFRICPKTRFRMVRPRLIMVPAFLLFGQVVVVIDAIGHGFIFRGGNCQNCQKEFAFLLRKGSILKENCFILSVTFSPLG